MATTNAKLAAETRGPGCQEEGGEASGLEPQRLRPSRAAPANARRLGRSLCTDGHAFRGRSHGLAGVKGLVGGLENVVPRNVGVGVPAAVALPCVEAERRMVKLTIAILLTSRVLFEPARELLLQRAAAVPRRPGRSGSPHVASSRRSRLVIRTRGTCGCQAEQHRGQPEPRHPHAFCQIHHGYAALRLNIHENSELLIRTPTDGWRVVVPYACKLAIM